MRQSYAIGVSFLLLLLGYITPDDKALLLGKPWNMRTDNNTSESGHSVYRWGKIAKREGNGVADAVARLTYCMIRAGLRFARVVSAYSYLYESCYHLRALRALCL